MNNSKHYDMSTKKQRARLKIAYERVLSVSNSLQSALEVLGCLASEVYGSELRADICNGYEIEFRQIENDIIDDFGVIRIEDLLKE